jgi:hypothetical protein
MARRLPADIALWDRPNEIPLVGGEEVMLVAPQLETFNERRAQQAQDQPIEFVEVPHIHSP